MTRDLQAPVGEGPSARRSFLSCSLRTGKLHGGRGNFSNMSPFQDQVSIHKLNRLSTTTPLLAVCLGTLPNCSVLCLFHQPSAKGDPKWSVMSIKGIKVYKVCLWDMTRGDGSLEALV